MFCLSLALISKVLFEITPSPERVDKTNSCSITSKNAVRILLYELSFSKIPKPEGFVSPRPLFQAEDGCKGITFFRILQIFLQISSEPFRFPFLYPFRGESGCKDAPFILIFQIFSDLFNYLFPSSLSDGTLSTDYEIRLESGISRRILLYIGIARSTVCQDI